MVSNERESKANVVKVYQDRGVVRVKGATTSAYYLRDNIKN